MVRLLTLPLLLLLPPTLAEFLTDFTTITHGRRVELRWERLDDPAHVPAYIAGRSFNATGDSSGGVNAFQANLTTELDGTSFLWINAPYPLDYIETADYELELRPQEWDVETQGEVPVLASSGLFRIRGEEVSGDAEFPTIGAGPQETEDEGSGGPSTTVIVAAVCVGLGIPILVGIGVWFWCMRKQKKRVAYEENRKRRFETIIH